MPYGKLYNNASFPFCLSRLIFFVRKDSKTYMIEKNHNFPCIFLGIWVLLAFFAQSAIPSGYMPSFKTGRTLEVSICHGTDIITILVDENMNPVEKGEDSKQKRDNPVKPCVFSSVSHKNIILQDFVFQRTEHLTYEPFVQHDNVQIKFSTPSKPYDGQAPPVFHIA
jgi:hypothetical protein